MNDLPRITTWLTLALVAIVLLLGFVGADDMAAAERDTEHYCAMVKGGHWPDYRGTYREVCP